MTQREELAPEDRVPFESWGDVWTVEEVAEGLDASNCDLDEFPEQFGGLSDLRRLDLSWNGIRELRLPEGLDSLERLDLSANDIERLPPLRELLGLRGLRKVNLAGNPLRLSARLKAWLARALGVPLRTSW
jgi:Leucine-rich repeat (LRR) protein